MPIPQRHDIVGKLWNLCNVLRDDGVTYHQYVTELTYLLFLKMVKETEQEDRLVIHKPPKSGAPAKKQKAPLGRPDDGLGPGAAGLLQRTAAGLGSHGRGTVQEIFANASTFIKSPPRCPSWSKRSTSSTGTARSAKTWATCTKACWRRNANEKKSGAGQYFTPRG